MLGLNAVVAGGSLVGQGFNYGANRTLNGGSGIEEQYQMGASILSAGVGVLAGSLTMNPAVGFGAAAVTESVAGPLARYLSAPMVEREKAQTLLNPLFSMYAGPNGRQAMEFNYLGKPVTRDATSPIGFGAANNPGNLQHLTDVLNNGVTIQGTLDDT